jgi:hypothetical protein
MEGRSLDPPTVTLGGAARPPGATDPARVTPRKRRAPCWQGRDQDGAR